VAFLPVFEDRGTAEPMSREPQTQGTEFELDAVLAEYMRRVDAGENPDVEAYIAAHPSLAEDLRKYFALASAVDRYADGTVDMASDVTDRRHPAHPATVAFTPSDAQSPASKPPGDEPHETFTGERFRKIRSHAKGGLGEVSLAQDEQLNRVVALKELQPKYANDAAKRTRFLLEGEVTGSLEHPGIVPVYAMGRDDQGRPFYVMRFIRGESLREAIRRFHDESKTGDAFSRNSLEFRQLLQRFVDVCNAIAFAHDRGVLHRDIKPENVMLGKFGESLVVDWGMARVVGRSLPEGNEDSIVHRPRPKHFSATREGSALGTPAYMSPEVAAGKLDQVGPPCDIFSIGASLYCLLTNRPPLHAETLTELLKKAERCDFPPAIEVNPRVPKALNAICCKAMALSATDRYGTALELADDIERWLADEAVHAYAESPAERALRWARRHRSWALAGAASLCIVAIVSTVAAGLINKSRREQVAAREEAVGRFAQSRRTIDNWLKGFTSAVEFYPNTEDFRDRILAQAADDYDSLAKQASDDPELELERGRILIKVGDLRRDLFKNSEAQVAYSDAGKIFESLKQRGVQTAAATLEIANIDLRNGIVAAEANNLEAASTYYTKALGQLESIVGKDVDQKRVTLSQVDVHTSIGMLLNSQGNFAGAEDHLQKAINLQSALVRATPTDLKLEGPAADARVRLGQVLMQRGDARGAVAQFEQAANYWDRRVALEPDHPDPFQLRADVRINLATAWLLLGHYQKETDAYRAVIADYEKLRKIRPDYVPYLENIAIVENDLGLQLNEIGQPREASELLIKARDEFIQLRNIDAQNSRLREELASCLINLGQAQQDLGQTQEALKSLESGEEILELLVSEVPDQPMYQERSGICRSHIGQIQASLGNADEAVQSLNTAITRLDRVCTLNKELVSARSALATARGRLGDVLSEQKDSAADANQAYEEAMRDWQTTVKLAPVAEYFHRGAWFFTLHPGITKQSKELGLEFAQKAAEAAPENGHYLGTLAAAEFRAGNSKQAIELLDRAAKLESYDRGRDGLIRALCQKSLGQSELAGKTLIETKTWISQNRPGNSQLKRLLAEAERQISDNGSPPSKP
jgi:serine/threonine-protein kinase